MKLKINIKSIIFTKSWLYTVLVDNSYHQFDIENEELNKIFIYET